MSEQIINLATFEFDTDRLEKSLSDLQDKMFAFKKETESNKSALDLVKKSTQELVKEQLKLSAAGKETSDAYKENEKTINDLNEAEKQLFKNQQNIQLSQSRVRQEISATNKELKAYMGTGAEYKSLIDSGSAALQTQVTNINQARASNTELLRVRNQLNPAIATEAKLITDLNAKMDANNKFIKTNASEYEKTKINIGNYTDSVKQALKETGLFGTATNSLPPAFRAVVTGFQQGGQAVKGINDAYKEYSKAQAEVKVAQAEYASLQKIAAEATNASAAATEKATAIGYQYAAGEATQAEAEAASTAAIIANTTATEAQAAATAAAVVVTNTSSIALKLFRLALISTGIGAIVVLLGSLVSYLTTTQSGIDALTSVTRPLQAVFQGLMSVLNGLGKTLVDVFNNPKKAITDFANFIKQNLINRFTALGDIIEGILNLDFGKVAESTVQAVTGVDNLVDKVKGAGSAVGKYLSDAAKKGAEVDRITKEMAKKQLEYNAAQVAFGDAIDKQLLISKDTSKSFAERGAAAKEIIRLSDENGKKEEEILQLELKRLKVQQSIKGLANLTNADKQEQIDLEKKIDDAQDRGLNARLEQSRVLAGLQKEAAAAELERIKKIQDARLAALKTELDFYIASQGEKKKSMTDEIAQAQEELNRKLAINKEEFAQKKINKREFELKNLEDTNEFLAKQTDAVISNADLELQLFLLNQQKKVDANQFYNDELYKSDLDRINREAEAEAAQQTLLFEKGKINAQEYALAIAQIDDKQRQANDAAAAQREQAKKDKQAADLAIQDELNQERFNYDLELQLQRNEIKYQAEKEAAVKNGADMIEFEKAQAARRKLIEDTVQKNKLQLASQTFSQLASLAGEQSVAGKAFAIAQTTIDTFQAATAAYKALAGIPIVGPALGVIAAAAATKSGLDNVKKITSVKDPKVSKPQTPSYARGLVTGAGTGTSDSVNANLSAGETVLTARASQMFPQEIAAINAAGGGVGLYGMQGSSSLMMQESIKSNADNSNNAQMIANAVYLAARLGTSEGSKGGIKELSTDRQIMSDAKF